MPAHRCINDRDGDNANASLSINKKGSERTNLFFIASVFPIHF